MFGKLVKFGGEQSSSPVAKARRQKRRWGRKEVGTFADNNRHLFKWFLPHYSRHPADPHNCVPSERVVRCRFRNIVSLTLALEQTLKFGYGKLRKLCKHRWIYSLTNILEYALNGIFRWNVGKIWEKVSDFCKIHLFFIVRKKKILLQKLKIYIFVKMFFEQQFCIVSYFFYCIHVK